MIRKHQDETGCIVGAQRTMETWRRLGNQLQRGDEDLDEGDTEHVEHKSWRSAHGKANVHSRLNYAKRIVIPRVEFEEEQDQDEEESGIDTFEALTTGQLMLISGSSENVARLGLVRADVKDDYRKVVEKLIKNVGKLCKDDMDKVQRKMLKKLVGDFRRQVVPRPHDYNAGGTLERREV